MTTGRINQVSRETKVQETDARLTVRRNNRAIETAEMFSLFERDDARRTTDCISTVRSGISPLVNCGSNSSLARRTKSVKAPYSPTALWPYCARR